MKVFTTDFASYHEEGAAVAYRFMIRVKGEDAKSLRVSFKVGSAREIQAYADALAKDEGVLSAAAEYLYSVDLKNLSRVVAIKSEDVVAEEV